MRKIKYGSMKSPKQQIRMSSIPKVAFRPYQYSFKLEDGTYSNTLEIGFAGLESRFADFFTKLNDSFHAFKVGEVPAPLTPQDHATICEYLFVHMVRVPNTLDWIRTVMKEANISAEQEFNIPRDTDRDQEWALYAFSNIGLKLGPKIFDLLMQKNISIEFFPRTRTSIVTGDNPVARTKGFRFPETQVLFPLDQRSFLRLHGVGTKMELANIRDLSVADQFNLGIIRLAGEEVYCANPAYVQNLLQKDGIEIAVRIPRVSLRSN